MWWRTYELQKAPAEPINVIAIECETEPAEDQLTIRTNRARPEKA